MKVKGPKGHKNKEQAIPAVTQNERLQGKELQPVAKADHDSQVKPATLSRIAEICAQLDAKQISQPQAMEALIQLIISERVGQMSSDLQNKLRVFLKEVANEDPILADKLKSLSVRV